MKAAWAATALLLTCACRKGAEAPVPAAADPAPAAPAKPKRAAKGPPPSRTAKRPSPPPLGLLGASPPGCSKNSGPKFLDSAEDPDSCGPP
jgi:hypothetical protein